jgi:hypothetical protein
MNTIQIFAYRGLGAISDSFFMINEKSFPIPKLCLKQETFNIRCIIEVVNDRLSYPDNLFGNKINELIIADCHIDKDSKISLIEEGTFDVEINLPFEADTYAIGCKVYEDYPANQNGIFEVISIPTNILTIYFYFYKTEIKTKTILDIEKCFDGFSHLGFFLTDLPKMKELIYKEYGDKKLDLVSEFTITDLIDKLMKEGIIMIVWGINPYTYPIYSSDNLELLLPILGVEHEAQGVFNIDESIKELSLIPGHKLRDWPDFTDEEWPTLHLYGEGKKTHLKPYLLKGADSETVIASFVIYRSEGYVDEPYPIVNVDLLYNL